MRLEATEELLRLSGVVVEESFTRIMLLLRQGPVTRDLVDEAVRVAERSPNYGDEVAEFLFKYRSRHPQNQQEQSTILMVEELLVKAWARALKGFLAAYIEAIFSMVTEVAKASGHVVLSPTSHAFDERLGHQTIKSYQISAQVDYVNSAFCTVSLGLRPKLPYPEATLVLKVNDTEIAKAASVNFFDLDELAKKVLTRATVAKAKKEIVDQIKRFDDTEIEMASLSWLEGPRQEHPLDYSDDDDSHDVSGHYIR